MINFDFRCGSCEKNVFKISYNTKNKESKLICANCGKVSIYEEAIGKKRKPKQVKKQVNVEVQNA